MTETIEYGRRMSDSSALVTVSGASGFIASHVIAILLARGYRVRGTVRSLAKEKELAHLRALPGAKERLELVEAELTSDKGWDAAIAGAKYVQHLASPYALTVADPQRDLVDPAVRGTKLVLEAAARAGTVERVVLTSSMAAITDEPDGAHVLTEADWNTKSSLKRNPYYYSKTLAEKEGWAFIEREKPRFDLVTINPFVTMGPSLSPGLNVSNQIFVDLLSGQYPGIMRLTWGFVDVRDVALAHVLAMETKTAKGRYLCANEPLTMRTVVEKVRALGYEKGFKLPGMSMDSAFGDFVVKSASYLQPSGVGTYLRSHVGRDVKFDHGKIEKELGLKFTPFDTSLKDTLADLETWGHLKRKS
jgi:dihydroflavonol-4-reductase